MPGSPIPVIGVNEGSLLTDRLDDATRIDAGNDILKVVEFCVMIF